MTQDSKRPLLSESSEAEGTSDKNSNFNMNSEIAITTNASKSAVKSDGLSTRQLSSTPITPSATTNEQNEEEGDMYKLYNSPDDVNATNDSHYRQEDPSEDNRNNERNDIDNEDANFSYNDIVDNMDAGDGIETESVTGEEMETEEMMMSPIDSSRINLLGTHFSSSNKHEDNLNINHDRIQHAPPTGSIRHNHPTTFNVPASSTVMHNATGAGKIRRIDSHNYTSGDGGLRPNSNSRSNFHDKRNQTSSHKNQHKHGMIGSSSSMPPSAKANAKILQKALKSPNSTIGKLNATLFTCGKVSATKRDSNGRLALHLLSLNESLISSFLESDYGNFMISSTSVSDNNKDDCNAAAEPSNRKNITELEKFVMDLVRSYPKAVITTDSSGRIPFTYALYDWVHYSAKGSILDGTDENDLDLHHNHRGIDNNYPGGQGKAKATPVMSGMEEFLNHPPSNEEKLAAAGGLTNHHAVHANHHEQDVETIEESSINTNNRSILTTITNVTLPSAFRSVYSNRNENNGHSMDPYGTRANYRRARQHRMGSNMDQSEDSYHNGSSNQVQQNQYDTNHNYNTNNNNEIKMGGTQDHADVTPAKTNVSTVTNHNHQQQQHNPHHKRGGSGGYLHERQSREIEEEQDVYFDSDAAINLSSTSRLNTTSPAALSGVGRIQTPNQQQQKYQEAMSICSDNSGFSIDDIFINNVTLPPLVEWNLRILSMILDNLDDMASDFDSEAGSTWQAGGGKEQAMSPDTHRMSTATTASTDNEWIKNTLVSAVASTPSLMKTLLLLDDKDPVKERVFSLSIVRRIVYSKYTIGNWLVYMLEAVDESVAKRGVDYLEMLSLENVPEEILGGTRTYVNANSASGYNGGSANYMESLYNKVARLDYLIPAILALEDVNEVDRASATKIIRHVADKELSKGGTLLLVFLDLFFAMLLLIAFQWNTIIFIKGDSYSPTYAVGYYMVLASILYGTLRKFSLMSSMVKISRGALAANCGRAVDWIDWFALGLVLGGTVWMEILINSDNNEDDNRATDIMRSYLAIATFAAWCKVLNWFNVVNWSAAKLFSALVQIAYDLRWLVFAFAAFILAFSQMFFIILSKPDICDDDESGFCNQKNVYLEVYAIAMGRFDITDFETIFSVIVFVIFTCTIAIILFHALTAITVDSYTKTMSYHSENSTCGNRARLVYVADARAFRRIMEGDWSFMQYCAAALFIASSAVIFMLSAIEIRNVLDSYYGKTIIVGGLTALLLFLLVSIAAFLSHMAYFDFEPTRTAGICSCFHRFSMSAPIRFLANPVYLFISSIIGLPKSRTGHLSTTKSKKRWLGMVSQVRRDMEQLISKSEEKTIEHLKTEVSDLDSRLKKGSDRTKIAILNEIRSSEERLERMIGEISSMLIKQKKATFANSETSPSTQGVDVSMAQAMVKKGKSEI